MRVVINCQHVDLTSALKEHVEAKVYKACDMLTAPPANCTTHLTVDGSAHKAEFVMHYKGHDFTASASNHSDMYVAIDSAVTKLRRQLTDFCPQTQ